MNESDDAEYEDHASTWLGFTRFVTISTVIVVVILLAMAALLV